MEPDPIQSTDAEGQQRPLVLEPSELALHRTTAPVQLPAALGLAGDQRVQPVSLDPR